ncbi:MAG: hydantoinase/oxoprolinase family protein [Elusimicrobiota bacterium]|jgi:N-methylhydantoinase A/oxoprolinase/acetone carboxylase beta subunit
MEKLSLGVDVGGTFTHAVALQGTGLVSQAKVPTTHTANDGVSEGIWQALSEVLRLSGRPAQDVGRVAYSTTQATNALLEGDVSPVGILAAGKGWEGLRAAGETEPGKVELAEGLDLVWHHEYLEVGDSFPEEEAKRLISRLKERGARAIVAASAFSVDDPALEGRIAALAVEAGLQATATHEISQLYGLKARTRTAALNAALLPKMVETAAKTEAAVRRLGITAPLVVMRSDGGAMDISEMKRRPILSILSGPAAGVAAALMSARVADGIFMEVGGTSTDISCIQNGHPSVRMARVGRHLLYLNTLDVRTAGVAGGSLPRADSKRIHSVGPRSAHIAGLSYSAFPKAPIEGLSAVRLAPKPTDPADYLALAGPGAAPSLAATPTCAANALGLLAEGDYSRGDAARAGEAFAAVGRLLGCDRTQAARQVLDAGAGPLIRMVEDLIAENKLDRSRVRLVGGGGGGGIWPPELGRRMNLPCSVVEHAPVISAIGAALALMQETVERTLIDPKPADVARIRQEAEQALLRAGAESASIEVRVEIDSQRGVLRAIAVGSHELASETGTLSESELLARAGLLLGSAQPALAAATEGFRVFTASVETRRLFGLWRTQKSPWSVLDRRGRARLGASHGAVLASRPDTLLADLQAALAKHARYGDTGRTLPPAFLVTDDRTVDLSGLACEEQTAAVCQQELGRLAPDAKVVVALNLEGS